MRDYSGGYARTTVQQNLVLRWVRRSRSMSCGWRCASSTSPPPARARPTDVVSCPGTDSCKLGITSSMGLNAARPGADRVDGAERSAEQPDPHQDERLPERLRSAPHRQHRLHGRLDQDRRAHRPRLHPADRRELRRRRRGDRASPQVAPSGQARARRGGALDPRTTRASAAMARPSTSTSSGSAPDASRSSSRTLRCRPSSRWRR